MQMLVNGVPVTITGEDFYIYEVDFLALVYGTSASSQINIEQNSIFTLQKLCCTADIAATTYTRSAQVVPLCTMLITDSGSSRQLMSAAAPVNNFFGDGMEPFIMPNPRQFNPNSTVTIAVANYCTATTIYNLRFSFIGKKTFYAG